MDNIGIATKSNVINFNQPYELTNEGLKPLTSEGKDNLQPGTWLKLHGYEYNSYIIVKKLDNENYLCVDVNDLHQMQQQAYSLKFLSQKTGPEGIQMYINDQKPAMDLDEVNDLFQKSEELRISRETDQKEKAAKRQEIIKKGKAIIEAKKPDWAKAVIVAYREIDDCDMMTDYFATKSGEPYILAWSKHTRDLFSEMRKAATNSGLKEIEHLGIGKGVFKPRVIICEDFKSNGSYYHKGSWSHWHTELENDEQGHKIDFSTMQEAEAFIDGKTPEPITFDDQLIKFEWKIEEEDIEHREKYSMGSGYYLKAGNAYSTGWKVEKTSFSFLSDDLYFAAGSGRYLVPEKKTRKKAHTRPENEKITIERITVKENEEKNGVEIYFPDKPADDIRNSLKANGFKWSRFGGCWYNKRSPESLEYAYRCFGTGKPPEPNIEPTPPEPEKEPEPIKAIEPEPEKTPILKTERKPEPIPEPKTTAQTQQLVKQIKKDDQDFEWYPTTPEIIKVIKNRCDEHTSVLDCGAGDGRVLSQITKGTKYAIEKAVPLIQAMPPDIVVVGTDFFQSTLIDKPVDVIFCNPPYSEYETWADKVITEAHAKKIFLVIPTRWKKSPQIQEALKKRGVPAYSLGTFDFLNAERAARVFVEILHIPLIKKDWGRDPDDPFMNWFDNEFNFKESTDIPDDEEVKGTTLKEKLAKAVVGGKGKVPMLVELYNYEMKHLYDNFKQISALDADLIKELGTSKSAIAEALKQRITGLKNKYWQELFDNLEDITNRLTSSSRQEMLNKLTAQTNVDFTESNIYAVLIWVIKNANKYYDNQLIEIVEQMVTEANIFNYKSNEKVYKFDRWRYRDEKDTYISHIGLELRIVLQRYQAIFESEYGRYEYPNNLHTGAHNFINDLITIANNLNFITPSWVNSCQVGDWESNKSKDFYLNEVENKILMSVKAFKNGNLHIKFNQAFIRRLNVEFGRLKGWLKDKYQAAEELNIPASEAAESFNCNNQITMSNVKLLTE